MPTTEIQALGEDELPLPFGVRAGTGDALPDFDLRVLKKFGVDPQHVIEKHDAKPTYAAVESVKDPNDLAQAGWGVILPAGISPDIVAALKPLLDRRKEQAGALYKEFPEYVFGQSAREWLNARGVTFAVVDPKLGVPLYLLIVGSPTQVPFDFQYHLDTYWNVGRIDFDTPAEYAAYAEAVVKYEQDATVPTTRSSALWITKNASDRATGLLHNQVGIPLAGLDTNPRPLGAEKNFKLGEFLGAKATKQNLEAILRGDIPTGRPALVFTGSHGVAFDSSDKTAQRDGQGALLSQAWERGKPATPDQYLRATDLTDDLRTDGMIHFMFACYGGGCPETDTYDRRTGQPVKLMDAPVIARLPQRLLAKGALAVLAHIDRAWAFSFQTDRGKPQVQEFRDVLEKLLSGNRIGQATDVFNMRWSVLAAVLQETAEINEFKPVPATNLANRLVARDDARNYLILGDPAVRLRVNDMA